MRWAKFFQLFTALVRCEFLGGLFLPVGCILRVSEMLRLLLGRGVDLVEQLG